MKSAILLTALAACAPPVPDQPSFQLDVLPLLAANCTRCHGTPLLGDAPPGFRLDMFGPTDVGDENEDLAGASDMASTIAYRTGLDEQQMPPRFPLDGWQIELFEQWSLDPVRGEPRPGNRAPHVIIAGVERLADRVTLRVEVEDTDGDPVGGELRAQIGADSVHVGAIRSGILAVTWATTGIAAGSYPLTAHVDDGAAVHTISLGTVEVGP